MHLGGQKNSARRLLFIIILGLVGVIWFLAFSFGQMRTVRIEGTGVKQEASFGTDIRIAQLKCSGTVLGKADVRMCGNWTVTDGFFFSMNTDSHTWIEIPLSAADTLEITFQTNEGSGNVLIYSGNASAEQLDLYTSALGTKLVTIQNANTPTFYQEWEEFLLLAYFLVIEYLLLGWILNRLDLKRRGSVSFHCILLLLGAVALFLCVEIIGSNLGGISPLHMSANIALYFLCMIVLYLFAGRVSWSIGIMAVLGFGYSIANYYVTILRGSPIMPADFLTLQTAANVAGQYSYRLPREFGCSLMLFLCIGRVLCFPAREMVIAFRKRLLLLLPLGAAALHLGLCFPSGSELDLWNLRNNVSKYGTSWSLAINTYHMQLSRPKSYSDERAQALLSEYDQSEANFSPNIIIIMNESFADLSVVMDRLDNSTYMPYICSLEENTVKGTAVSSVIGGMTSNSEYELLTGHSMYFMKNHVPYQQLIYHGTYSLVGELKERGYTAVAIHPYDASGYNRPKVYEWLGFDRFISIDYFSDYELIRNLYVSDRDSYEKVIEEFEKIQQTDAPAFLFNITMQNHSDYSTGWYGSDVITVPGVEGQFPDVEEYLTLIRESDRALQMLIEYFDRVDEETVILFFGDHQPNIDIAFYEMCFGKDRSSFSLQDWQQAYEVPFFIWANYDIEEEQGLYTSLNYLNALLFEKTGISTTPYQNFLLQLQLQIPAITRNAYLDSSGQWQSSPSEYSSRILDPYWTLQYYLIRNNP